MTIQFHTRVSKRGMIKIPSKFKLEDSEVKIIVETESCNQNENFDFESFVSNWGGFFKTDIDIDQAKYDYLTAKYK
jgi:hypothetical protein